MEITTKSYQEEIKESKIPVLLECWASWCLPCKQVDPVLLRLKNKYYEKCKILKINVDKNPKISKMLNIKGLPTFISFYNGKEIERKVGSQSDVSIEKMIEKLLNIENGSGETNDKENEIIEQQLKNLGYL